MITGFGIRMILFLILFLLISLHSMETTISGCHSDRDKDHLPRVSCVSQGLAAVPDGIDSGTQVLVLSQNVFVSLSWSSYTTFTHLQELDLSQNLISSIDSSGPVLKYLRVLRLSDNKLTSLGKATFNSTPSLMEVYLDRNAISSLHAATFSDLLFLELINLSRNKLHLLPTYLLQNISSSNLKNFDLEDNHVQHLPDHFFAAKPDIPYVFLSKNPWVCTCQVGYLQQYLEDQGHNIYTHTGPSSIENDPESVVCSAPSTLHERAIVDLKEEEYCSSDTNTHTLNTALATTIFQTYVIKTHHPTTTPRTIQATTPSYTKSSTPTSTPISTSTPTTNNSTTNPPTSAKPTTTTPTATPTITQAITPNTTPTTATPNTTPTTTATTTEPNTTTTQTTATPKTKGESRTAPVRITATESVTRVTRPMGGVRSARGGSQHSVIWCWWLFITVLLLSVFSVSFSCILFVWLVVIYIILYRPIKRQVCGGQRVTLRAYQVTADESPRANTTEEKKVLFLPTDIVRETQAVFRSVLFIAKGAEDHEVDERNKETRDEEKKKRSNAETKIDLLPAVTLHREQTESKDREQVFRKTFYRLISREEEIEGWTEVQENCWQMTEQEKERRGGGVERIKTHYSLILREERGSVMEGRKEEAEWLVGEWEMSGGNCQSLIRMKEECRLSDMVKSDGEAETSF